MDLMRGHPAGYPAPGVFAIDGEIDVSVSIAGRTSSVRRIHVGELQRAVAECIDEVLGPRYDGPTFRIEM